jgi:hypothetical protein
MAKTSNQAPPQGVDEALAPPHDGGLFTRAEPADETSALVRSRD